MDEKEFFARLAAVGPDGKFSAGSQRKGLKAVKTDINEASAKEVDLKLKSDDSQREKSQKIAIEKAEENEKEVFEEPDSGEEGQLAVDVYSTPLNFVVEAAIAGARGEDMDIAIANDSITIKGRRFKEGKNEELEYLFSECFWGKFSRSIILPEEIDADKSSASFKNGVLKIVLPKVNRQKTKKIKIRFD